VYLIPNLYFVNSNFT